MILGFLTAASVHLYITNIVVWGDMQNLILDHKPLILLNYIVVPWYVKIWYVNNYIPALVLFS